MLAVGCFQAVSEHLWSVFTSSLCGVLALASAALAVRLDESVFAVCISQRKQIEQTALFTCIKFTSLFLLNFLTDLAMSNIQPLVRPPPVTQPALGA